MMKVQLRLILAALAVVLVAAPVVRAADLTMRIQPVGNDVVGTYSGSVNTEGLGKMAESTWSALIRGDFFGGDVVFMGLTGKVIRYTGVTSSFNNFTTNDTGSSASAAAGNTFGLNLAGANTFFYLPENYVSGSPLSGTATWANSSLLSLELIPGTYTFNWGSGANAGTGELIISNVPEPSTYALSFIATGVMAAVARRRKARQV